MESPALQALYGARSDGNGPVDIELNATRPEALDLQLKLLDRFIGAGDSVGGWKVSFTSGRSRDSMGPGYRPFGYILRSHVFVSGARIALPGNCPFSLEPELCLVLAAPLAGPVSRAVARSAVGAVASAFEINQARVPAGAPDVVRLADGTGNWGIVVGAPNSAAVESDSLGATTVRVFKDDAQSGGSPAEPEMDDPFASLAALSDLLARHGRSLRAGDHVITGSFTRLAVTGPARWRAEFCGVGEVSLDVISS
jgi:2-keto-4-pentenoate hydratase